MALLTLKDIGKIYVSDGNVSVGIRGINLSFDRGEFVAVTGKSGSGKSTLLNVIGGMDTYEEGELFIEGEPTSHYLQPDWEEYCRKYISFIFQDYNIIESYTVLQNVELALMHISDKRERRRRALELIDRVGLTKHLRHKGSKLSGGQKQRTVIARALAKDSPIILADEPTGNLDSATSAEIIDLLREVSRDKLLIMVTHNFEQVEHCATRHIRIFDGTVESDHVFERRSVADKPVAPAPAKSKKEQKREQRKNDLKNGVTLGLSMFTSRPRLSIFLCVLMILGNLGIYFITASSGDASNLFPDNRMFSYMEGRVVLTTRSGEVITDEELARLAAEYGAESYLHYDRLLDEGYYYAYLGNTYCNLKYAYNKTYGDKIVGRYPEAKDEVFLYLPIGLQEEFGKDEILRETVEATRMSFRVVGLKYFYDNHQKGEILFHPDGFRAVTAANALIDQSDIKVQVKLTAGGMTKTYGLSSIYPFFNMKDGKVYVSDTAYQNAVKAHESAGRAHETTVDFSAVYYGYNYYNVNASTQNTYEKTFEGADITQTDPGLPPHYQVLSEMEMQTIQKESSLAVSVDCITEMGEEFLSRSYRQASLFFADDKLAAQAVARLADNGYIAVLSDSTYTPDPMETVLSTLGAILAILMWLAVIFFIAFFINLCSTRSLNAFRGDMAIMRSMGIPVRVIRVGMYVRMLIALIPAYLTVMIAATVIYMTPALNNGGLVFLYPWHYAVIFVGMLVLTVRVTRMQIKKLFRQSVKKALKGDASV